MALATFAPSGYALLTAATVPSISTTPSGITATNFVVAPMAIALPAGSAPAAVLLQNLGPDPASILIAAAAATTTATQAIVGSRTIVVASASGVAIGQVVVAAGISQGTLVVGISGTTITISQPTTAALSTTAVNFITAVTTTSGIACMPGAPLALAYVASGFVCGICLNPAGRSIISCTVGV